MSDRPETACSPLLIPLRREPLILKIVHSPPISMAPTPMYRVRLDHICQAYSLAPTCVPNAFLTSALCFWTCSISSGDAAGSAVLYSSTKAFHASGFSTSLLS